MRALVGSVWLASLWPLASLAPAVVMLAACTPADEPASCPPDLPSCALGYDALFSAGDLARDRQDLVSPALVSSYDRTGGNLDLGFAVPGNSVLYLDADGRYVIFDERGPGLLTRLWLTHPDVLTALQAQASTVAVFDADIQFRFDDEPAARIAASFHDFFGGARPPFLAPVVADPDRSSGGYVSYAPLAFAERLVVSTSRLVPYLQLGFYRVAGPVVSFDPAAVSQAQAEAAASAWQAAPKPRTAAPIADATQPLVVPALGSADVTLSDGPGVVWDVTLAFDAPLGFRPGLRLRVVTDGATTVDVPFADFFATPLADVALESAFVAHRTGDRSYHARFPMPFAHTWSLVLEDSAGVARNVSARVSSSREPVDGLLRFHADYREAAIAAADPDFELLALAGRGHYAGAALTLCCRGTPDACHYLQPGGWGFLEGDETLTVDGVSGAALHGTGTEDYFNAGYYYLAGRPFALPTHGMPYRNPGALGPAGEALPAGATDCTTQYRFHPSDPVPFAHAFSFALEHGPESNLPVWYAGVGYYYLAP